MEKKQKNKLPTELARNKQGQIYLLGNTKGAHWAGAKSLSTFQAFCANEGSLTSFLIYILKSVSDGVSILKHGNKKQI